MKYIADPVEVEAFVILGVLEALNHNISITIEEDLGTISNISISKEMTSRYYPVTGDYYVIQSDGYAYLNPKNVFERKYSPIHPADTKIRDLDFGAALTALKSGRNVQRSGWNGKGLWLTLQVPDENSRMTLPYIYMSYPADSINTPDARVPWLASQTDVLTEDWCIVNITPEVTT